MVGFVTIFWILDRSGSCRLAIGSLAQRFFPCRATRARTIRQLGAGRASLRADRAVRPHAQSDREYPGDPPQEFTPPTSVVGSQPPAGLANDSAD